MPKRSGNTSKSIRLSIAPRFCIRYNGNNATGGTAPVDSNYYKPGTPITVKGNTGVLLKTGCTFAGWNTAADGSGKIYAPGDTIIIGSADMTLFAGWAASRYTVTFNSLGGSAVQPQTVHHGETVTKPAIPAKPDFSFVGWFKDSLCMNEWNFAVDTVIRNITLFAKWVKKLDTAYTITFNAQGGSVVPPQTVKHGDTATKPPSPAKPDHVFAGWFKDSLCKTEWVFSSEPVTGNVTLYAKWIPKGANQHTVSFNTQGGTAVPPQMVNHGSKVTKPADPTKAGYDFVGWFKDSLGTIEWQFSIDTVTANVTLFAKWLLKAPNKFTVMFTTQGGGTIPIQQVDSGGLVTKPTPDPKKNGYAFVGWCKDSLGTIEWNFATDKVTGKMELYAKWMPNKYKVAFESNGGTKIDTQTVEYGCMVTAPSKPTKTGHTFADWYQEADFKNKWIFTTDKVTGDMTLYAKWSVNKYRVAFESNGGTKIDTQMVEYGGTVTAPSKPAKTGYTFADWYKEADFKTKWTFATDKVVVDMTLYAQWLVETYSITYILNNGINDQKNPKTYTIESETITLMSATRNGYDFGGWYLEPTFVTPVTAIENGSAGHMTHYARWTPTTYTITYVLNGGNNASNPPTTYTIESSITLPLATKISYTFEGWHTDEACNSEKVETISIGNFGNKKYYAKWIITDRDGNVYTEINIGNQVWMVENLKTTKYNDGTDIPLVKDGETWNNLTTPGYCWYDNFSSNKDKYGALYNWYAVDTKKIALAGWHVPTDEEWYELENYLIANGYNYDGSTAGNGIAKSMAAKTDWTTILGEGGAIGKDLSKNNRSGFTALPGGCRNGGDFSECTTSGFWWSATKYGDVGTMALYRSLYYGYSNLERRPESMNRGHSVRLIRD